MFKLNGITFELKRKRMYHINVWKRESCRGDLELLDGEIEAQDSG